MKYLRHIILVAANIFMLAAGSCAQDSLANKYNDISEIKFQKNITKFISGAYIGKNEDPEMAYPDAEFVPGLKHKGVIPNDFIIKKVLVKFNICNPSDSAATIFFFPGFYYKEIELYKVVPGGIKKLPSILPQSDDSIGFRGVTMQPKDSATIVAALTFVKTYNNIIRPRLINAGFLPSFISEYKNNHTLIDLITYILCGLLLMMILFSLANYFQGANPEFLFYSGYAFFLGFMLFLMARYNFRTNAFSYFLEGYLDFVMQLAGIIFYMIFMQRFLNTRENHPFLYKLYNFGLVLSTAAILAYTYFHYFSNNFNAENLAENMTKVVLLLMVIIFLVYSIRHWQDKLLRYLFWGNLCLFIFSLISQLASFIKDILNSLPGIFSSSIFYYEIGLFLELVFFLGGLNHKNNRRLIAQTKERETLKAQNQLKEYEKELAVYKAQQEERERISADMHDELGSGMTAIRLMSEIARNKMKENTPIEIEKISRSANDVLNKMNAIIWSMNSGNDTLDNLVSYIRSYALEYFDGTPIDCKVNTPENIPDSELIGDKRRNIFLCIKETLNNALKHSNASLIIIDIELNHQLKISIADNGTGIDLENLRQFGNGLKNIGRRMESIGGTFKIENNNGTITTLELPL
jgi:signal transduction histidine kinase